MIGFEVFHLIRQVRHYLRALLARLRLLASAAPPVLRRFVREWVAALDRTFSRHHVLRSRRAAINLALELLRDRADLHVTDVPELAPIAADQYDVIVLGKEPARCRKRLMHRIAFAPARPEPIEPYHYYVPACMSEALPMNYAAGDVFAGVIARVESCVDVDEALDAVAGAEAAVRALGNEAACAAH